MRQIRVAIVDDQAVFRQALRRALEIDPMVNVVAEAADGLAGIQMVEEQRPDVVLMDINMPGMDGYTATKAITTRFPDIRVIILSMHSESAMTAMSCQVGACYHLCKGCSPSEILAAINDGHQRR